ncbi:hypothetical protein [Pseudonocardia sp. MH-G8]|uniref:hypothetical protein n=1 Tax=Pseudonocardia sp. MH-G8 TaxID=1854588 RepID=UPI000BA15A53|nr:hypothetical protein [Pseudonocardia sp. MH-G8]OZM82463.1 hypothetical protein CFP66_12085 [Pseudonocardia sp. MH-G8]
MSELVTDLDWLAAARYPNADDDWGPAPGRHSYSEDAALTPIFHALSRSGRRSRQNDPAGMQNGAAQNVGAQGFVTQNYPTQRTSADPVDAFRRDPLTAPIPVQALATTTTTTTPRRRRDRPEGGRHHRSREGTHGRW